LKLGNYAHISISVGSLRESAHFYERLGFRKLFSNDEPHPWALFTDGRLNVHLYEFDFSSPALHYFSAKMHDTVLELMRSGIKPELQKSRDGNRKQHNFFDPNELSVMLMHHSDADMPMPSDISHSLLGVFGELSISTDDVKSSIGFWRKLGFIPIIQGELPYVWATLTDGVMTLGLHQTRTFTTPALTYFAPDIPERLDELKRNEISFAEISGGNETNGAILTAPDGQLLFLLKGTV
jgi:hypothetical protein